MSSLRQSIFDAVETQFQTITIANGYQTNIGNSVQKWREFAVIQVSEMPCIIIGDIREEPDLIGIGRNQVHNRNLEIDYHVLIESTTTELVIQELRKAQADIEKAIREDVKWSNLALWTVPQGNEIGFPEEAPGELTGVLNGSFIINYRTAYFNSEQ